MSFRHELFGDIERRKVQCEVVVYVLELRVGDSPAELGLGVWVISKVPQVGRIRGPAVVNVTCSDADVALAGTEVRDSPVLIFNGWP